jgi:transposase
VFTDEYGIYDGLGARVNEHKRINHSSKVYVMGDVHTNTIEGFWSLVKRDRRRVPSGQPEIFAELFG